MTQYGFFFDASRCTGCKTCELACKDYKDLMPDVSFRKVYDYEGGTCTQADDGTVTQDSFAYHVAVSCQHCSDPACVRVCPTTAMGKDADTGIVSVDSSLCIGCGYCVMACPYNAPKIDRSKGYSVKCDGCKDRIAAGLQAICVQSCPLRALEFDDIYVLRRAHGDLAAIAPLPAEQWTHPNLVIKPCPCAKAPGDTTGFIANPKEVE